MDQTVKLPDGVLCHVFSYVPSTLDRFRLGAVNKKLRRCVFKEMKKPKPLEMNLVGSSLFGHQVRKEQWLPAVRVLAKEGRFNHIRIRCYVGLNRAHELLLNTLATNKNCLSLVTQIKVRLNFLNTNIPRPSALESVIRKCAKLSVLELDFTNLLIHWSKMRCTSASVLDLAAALKGKHITGLSLKVGIYTQQEMITLFRSIQPNTLRKLELCGVYQETLDVADLMRGLCNTNAESLEQIDFVGYRCKQPADLFACIGGLPELRDLSITGQRLHIQFSAALKLLFGNHARTTQLDVKYEDLLLNLLDNCQLLARIRELQKEIPDLVFGFDHSVKMKKLKLSLRNVAIGLHSWDKSCANPDCHDCRSCYPVVVSALKREAQRELDAHLENHWLNRCKIGNVTDKLNDIYFPPVQQWKALHVVENQAHDRATITFQGGNGTQFQITLNTGRCFDRSCVRCLVI